MSTTNSPLILPWLRTGLASRLTDVADGGTATQSSSTVTVAVNLHAKGSGPDHVEPVPSPDVRLRGPGDVIGLDPAQVVRCAPEDGGCDAEANYFAHVELAAADLPWRYTPAAPDNDRLQPWIALVVVEDGAGGWLQDRPAGRCPLLHVSDPAQLPDPTQTWAWAHVHSDDDLAAGLAGTLAATPDAVRSRLLCPRRLQPNRGWLACIVPTFEAGRVAGGGTGPVDRVLAWDPAQPGEVTLPAYYHWRFSTGPKGDFESLVLRLTPRALPGSVGRRDLDISAAGSGLPRMPGAKLSYAGALVAPSGADLPWPDKQKSATKAALRELVNLTRTRGDVADPYQALADDPVVGPPAYAAPAAHRRFVPAEDKQPKWFEELSTEPNRRAVAGLAAEVIRTDQEALVAAAWEYAAGVREVNKLTSRARAAWEVTARSAPAFHALADATLLQVAGPAMPRLRTGDETVAGQVASSQLPAGLISGAFRRTCQKIPGLSSRTATGDRQRPAYPATSDFLSDPAGLLRRWTPVVVPAGAGLDPISVPPFGGGAPTPGPAPAPAPGPADPGSLADAVRTAINPARTIRAMLDARISGLDANRPDDAPAQLLATPTFSTPMYARLAALSVEHLVPGADTITDNTVGLLTVNQVFVEAFLAGANHELGREFRWREYPTPLDETWLRRFWDTVDGGDDIRPIARWQADKSLGANAPANATPAELVLLVTGPLLRRYPDTRVYAVAARWDGDRRVEDKNGEVRLPVFTGTLGRGRTFFGFALAKKEARGSTDPTKGTPGWFFVFEEPPGAPRFGLNAPAGVPRSTPPAPTNWSKLSWSDVTPVGGPLATFVDTSGPDWLVTAGSLPGNAGTPTDVDAWGENSAAMARITVQRPVRVLIHADSMLAKEPT